MPPFAPSSPTSDGLLLIRRLQLVAEFEMRRDQMPHEPLLLHDAAAGVDHLEAELVDQTIVLFEDLPLKEAEALVRVRAPAEVHARLVKFQFYTARHQPIERGFDR